MHASGDAQVALSLAISLILAQPIFRIPSNISGGRNDACNDDDDDDNDRYPLKYTAMRVAHDKEGDGESGEGDGVGGDEN